MIPWVLGGAVWVLAIVAVLMLWNMRKPMALFTAHVDMDGEEFLVEYTSIEECLDDPRLARLLDTTNTEVILWSGSLRITGRAIQSSQELREALDANANTILRRAL
jgi:hypothetical protein